MKITTVNVEKFENGDYGIDLNSLLEKFTTRVSTVKYYQLKEIGDGMIVISLYNKNKRKIKLKLKK